MKVRVKHGAKEVEVEADASSTIEQLSIRIEEVTGILARKQRLLHKGRVLSATATLQECKLLEGSSVMLLASSPAQTQVLHRTRLPLPGDLPELLARRPWCRASKLLKRSALPSAMAIKNTAPARTAYAAPQNLQVQCNAPLFLRLE